MPPRSGASRPGSSGTRVTSCGPLSWAGVAAAPTPTPAQSLHNSTPRGECQPSGLRAAPCLWASVCSSGKWDGNEAPTSKRGGSVRASHLPVPPRVGVPSQCQGHGDEVSGPSGPCMPPPSWTPGGLTPCIHGHSPGCWDQAGAATAPPLPSSLCEAGWDPPPHRLSHLAARPLPPPHPTGHLQLPPKPSLATRWLTSPHFLPTAGQSNDLFETRAPADTRGPH